MKINFDKWNIEDMTGYQPVTTLWYDFQIAEAFGIDAIKDTAERMHNEYKDDVQLYAELVLVINHHCWRQFNKGNQEVSKVYSELYYKYNDFAYDHFKGKDIEYYFNTLD